MTTQKKLLAELIGTSVNPARSFGPAIFAGGKALSQLWLFFVAPILGAVLAALIWKFGFETEDI
jgi:aquaporin Z